MVPVGRSLKMLSKEISDGLRIYYKSPFNLRTNW
jgi:hypothetical protein